MKFSILFLMSVLIFINYQYSSAQIYKIYPDDPSKNYRFGHFVNVYNIRVFVGVAASKNHKNSSYVFKKKNKKWVEKQKLDTPERSIIEGEIIKYGLIQKNDKKIEFYQIISDTFVYVKDIFQTEHYIFSYSFYDDWGFVGTVMDTFYNTRTIYENYFLHYEGGDWKIEKVTADTINDYSAFPRQEIGAKADINNNYCAFSHFSVINYTNDIYKGEVLIYKLQNGTWEFVQKIDKPENTGYALSLSPDNKFLAIQAYTNKTYIYENIDGLFQLQDSITGYYDPYLNIQGNDLLLGKPGKEKGIIGHFKYKNGNWQKQSDIHPPDSDIYCNDFGWSIDRYGETVVTGALADNKYGYLSGAAYIFQIPARDTLTAAICKGESYTFNDTVIYDTGHYTDTLLASYGVDSVVQLYLTVYPKEQIEIDTVLCDGQQLIVGDSVLTEEGIYTITLQNQYGCDSIVTAKIEYDDIEVVDSITADYGCQNGEIKLSVEGNNPPYAFKWSEGQTGEYINGLTQGKYDVTITSHSGCVYDYEYEVGDSVAYLIPNAFFPSGQEELNATFKPYTAKDVHILSTEIYDRWGEKVFSGAEDEFWDGTYQGKMQSPGIYLYRIVIDSPCGEEVKTGQVVLLR